MLKVVDGEPEVAGVGCLRQLGDVDRSPSLGGAPIRSRRGEATCMEKASLRGPLLPKLKSPAGASNFNIALATRAAIRDCPCPSPAPVAPHDSRTASTHPLPSPANARRPPTRSPGTCAECRSGRIGVRDCSSPPTSVPGALPDAVSTPHVHPDLLTLPRRLARLLLPRAAPHLHRSLAPRTACSGIPRRGRQSQALELACAPAALRQCVPVEAAARAGW